MRNVQQSEVSWRGAFDLNPDLVYLNSANLSMCPRQVLSKIHQYQIEFESNPTRGLNEASGHLWESQTSLAKFLETEPENLFLRPNVTSVLNTFILGLPLPKRSEILVGEFEYGAIVNICRRRCERDDLRLRVLKIPATSTALKDLSAVQLFDGLVSQIGPETRMILLSHVLGGLGLVMPIAELSREARRRGIFLVVDGAYAPGALSVSLGSMEELDFYGCSLYKWMMGPKGTAFGWVSKRSQSLLEPLEAGWNTYEPSGPFSQFGRGDSFQRRFVMSGCHDFAPFRAIKDTIEFWHATGPERIRRRMGALREHLDGEVAKTLGWSRVAPQDTKLLGPLMTYRLPSGMESKENRFVQFNTAKIRGGWHAIFSPHIYNTEAEIARGIGLIA